MADAVASQTIQDGPRYAWMKFTNLSDGTGESAVTKVDVSELANHPKNGEPVGVNIRRIRYTTVGMGLRLLWDADTDVTIWEIPADADGDLYFGEGGLPNNAGAGKTGDIKLTTLGHTSGDSYTLELELVKKYGT